MVFIVSVEEMPDEEFAVTTKTSGLKCIGALDRFTLAPQTVLGLVDISSPAPGIDVELIGRGGNRIARDKGSDFLSGVPLALQAKKPRAKNRGSNRIATFKSLHSTPFRPLRLVLSMCWNYCTSVSAI